MILTENGVLKLMQRIKSFITSQLNTKAASVHTHSISEIENLSSQLGGGYTKSEVDTLLNDYIPKSGGGGVITGTLLSKSTTDSYLAFGGGTTRFTGGCIDAYGKDESNYPGWVVIRPSDDNNYTQLILKPDGTATWDSKNLAMQEDTVPRSLGSVITGNGLYKTSHNANFEIGGGTNWGDGATINLSGGTRNQDRGNIVLAANNGTVNKLMYLIPDGTWTWTGQPCQTASDQRLKQQISKIDNALLDAWEDVDLVQFKYNDAVNEKGSNARLHTGYVVQQIDEACQKHDVDISEYGLYCHEEYHERTEEVEVEQEDGTIKKETRVIEEASEHYSLRYTETLVVECAYLRRENKRLNDRLTTLEELFKQYIAK